jgi:WD40 repeat protein
MWADGILIQQGSSDLPAVTVGGMNASTFPLSIDGYDTWRTLAVALPSGQPGWANVTLSLKDGTSEITKNMVQFLAKDVTLTSAAYTGAVYDSSRDLFYLTGADNTIGVFNPKTQTLQQPMQSSTISSGAALGSLALTPDNSKLLVSDPTDHSVVVFDLKSGTSTAVNVRVASDGTATVSAPMPVATLTGSKALVVMTPWAQNEVREIDLAQMTVQVRTDVQSTSLFSVVPSTIAASTDGSVALLGGASPGNNAPFYVWRYSAAKDSFSAPMSLSYAQGDAVAVNGDGTVLAVDAYTLDQNLLPLVPFQLAGTNILLPGAGGLGYSAGRQVQISDTRDGRRLLSTAPLPARAAAFAVDPSGREILVCAGTSLNYYELAVVPLAVATVNPAAATPGTALTIRGNGFVAGTTATIAGTSSSCTQVDGQTLQCVVPNVTAGMAPITLSNPDGQTFSLEAAVNVE